MNNFGFAGGSSQIQVNAAITAFRKFESLLMGLSEEEREQVFEASPICNICLVRHMPWGDWE